MIKDKIKYYSNKFASNDDELYSGEILNIDAEDWMNAHIPIIDIPDKELEEKYYFRWWTYRKHIKRTQNGYVITEFLPNVSWAGKYNTIACASAHHITEGRWLRNTDLLDSYLNYWYSESNNINDYVHWLEYAVFKLCCLRKDFTLGIKYVDNMIHYYKKREETNFIQSEGLFWSLCDREGMEYSISGNGLRLPINCYMAANAFAISKFLEYAGRNKEADIYKRKNRDLVSKINSVFWDEKKGFYCCIHMTDKDSKPDYNWEDPRFSVRELWGYLPWYFSIATNGREHAFAELFESLGFSAPYGLTTAETRHEGFGCFYTGEELNEWLRMRGDRDAGIKGHECLWNGPIWPFSTSQAITAVSSLLRNYEHSSVAKEDFFSLLKTYAQSQRIEKDGKIVPWIDENMNPFTGDWISRTRLKEWTNGNWALEKGGIERGKDYNHSTFCDLVINGLFGVECDEEQLLLSPLFPDEWEYAILEHLPYGGKLYTIKWDRDGKYYGRGKGLFIDEEKTEI